MSDVARQSVGTVHNGVRFLLILSHTTYIEDWYTANLVRTNLFQNKPFWKECVTCEMKSYQSHHQYQEYLQLFPRKKFPNLNMVVFLT